MKNPNIIFDFLKDVKPSLFLTVVMFIVGMVVPGACGLAIYDIELFKEIDIFRLILLSIGICSPSILISLFQFLEPKSNNPENNSIELIFLFSGFISIYSFILIISIYYFLSFSSNISIQELYILMVVAMLLYSMFVASKRSKKYKENLSNDTQTNDETPASNEENS